MKETPVLPSTLWKFIWYYLKYKKGYLAGFVFVGLIWAIEMSLSPYLLKVIIDTVAHYSNDYSKMIHIVLFPCIFYASMTLILNVNFRFYDYLKLHFFPVLKGSVTKDLFSYVLQHSSTFFQNTFTGNVTHKLVTITDNIEQLLSIPSELFLPRFFAVCIACYTLTKAVHPLLGLILAIWAILFVSFSFMAQKKPEFLSRQISEAIATIAGTLSDAISNAMSIKLFDTAAYEVSLVNNDIDQIMAQERAIQWYNLKINFLQFFSITALITIMLVILMNGIREGWVSPGDFALVFTLLMSFIGAVFGVGDQIRQFSRIMGSCRQALTIIEIPPDITDTPTAHPLVIKEGRIKFDQVFFHYEKMKPLFSNLSIQIYPSEKVGLVGLSGGGKSTFIKLILRLIDTQHGHIFIDDQDIKQVTQSSLRQQIATIQQEPELFHRTIMDNIRFAKVDATDEEVIAAAKKAKCHEFILELPKQYESIVGERGIKLSGGQKQRVAIARAFLKNAPILLLDEATSSLDSITENDVQEALLQVMSNRTTIAIAHRLSTLKNMSRILVFEQGKIIEDGSLESLLKNKNSRFYQLWQLQALGFVLQN